MSCPASPHALLSPPADIFSRITVQRADIVWNRLGRTNAFSAVCRYYHILEALESRMTPQQRHASQRLDFDLLSMTSAPTSPFQQEMFPNLYPRETTNPFPQETTEQKMAKPLPNQNYEFSNTGTNEANNEEIIAIREMIKCYCLEHKTNVGDFLNVFSQHASRYGFNPTLSNIVFFIQYQKVLQGKMAEKQAEAHNNMVKREENVASTSSVNYYSASNITMPERETRRYGLFSGRKNFHEVLKEEPEENIVASVLNHALADDNTVNDAESTIRTLNTIYKADAVATDTIKQTEAVQERTEVVVEENISISNISHGMTYAQVTERKSKSCESALQLVETDALRNVSVQDKTIVLESRYTEIVKKRDIQRAVQITTRLQNKSNDETTNRLTEADIISVANESKGRNHRGEVCQTEILNKNIETKKEDKNKLKIGNKNKTKDENEADKENSVEFALNMSTSSVETPLATSNELKPKKKHKRRIKTYEFFIQEPVSGNVTPKMHKDSNRDAKPEANEHTNDACVQDNSTHTAACSGHDAMTTNISDMSQDAIQRLKSQIVIFNQELARARNNERSRSDSSFIVSNSDVSGSIDLLGVGFDCSLVDTSNLSEDFDVLNKKRCSTSSQ